ncbi:hypothetical protein COV04_03770 [Candidatus Uhrbacteria bacterium CG10_big_fil_rev_8_21_14_0_10_48_11]|uniref:DUF5652 domain-containing protein n=1 Tax=Candidatus Uhrbacteria bacterium CG10_big_fil_rev_8_21_14_0_10_48_11 TaxID=1975037 RepID=A0A2M8LE07_9BACT|nr:MAG: hypothetical protein COV04_03770 [Candidatus Uhrbacteria bacterium CG10_big_fil_rev_8_21_14_0_10_48_11]
MQEFINSAYLPLVVLLLAVWVIPWKGVAPWRAARRHDLGWFIALLIINTVGILEIIYIFDFSKRPQKNAVADQ